LFAESSGQRHRGCLLQPILFNGMTELRQT
jgi:hypothetical protein